MCILVSNMTNLFILILVSKLYFTHSFTPLSKEEQIKNFNKLNDDVEPFRRNLTECARQVKASMVDVENFLKRIPQSSVQEVNRAVYGHDTEVMTRLNSAIAECSDVVEGIFEICEYASIFNDCMHMRMEHLLDKVTMERRMETLGQMTSNPDIWTEDDDEILKLVKDEL